MHWPGMCNNYYDKFPSCNISDYFKAIKYLSLFGQGYDDYLHYCFGNILTVELC